MVAASSSATFKNVHSDFVAVILAASVGKRLYPLTSAPSNNHNNYNPKHLLPVAGIPLLHRLLIALDEAGFQECVLALAHDDDASVTVKSLCGDDSSHDIARYGAWKQQQQGDSQSHIVLKRNNVTLTILRLSEDCFGSAEALRQLESFHVLPKTAHVAIVPSDLVVLDVSAITELIQAHRMGQQSKNFSDSRGGPVAAAACTLLLEDVGQVDENGAPLKESAKQKMGGLAREKEDIEYMALSYSTRATTTPRLVWKQPKLDAEEDKDLTGESPKLIIPKPRLRVGAVTKIRMDYNDIHVYILAPWVRQLLLERTSLISLQEDLVPQLVARQFQGIADTFGTEPMRLNEILSMGGDSASIFSDSRTMDDSSVGHNLPAGSGHSKLVHLPYSVLAHVHKGALRSPTAAAYLYSSKELIAKATADGEKNGSPCISFPKETSVRAKFGSIVLPGAELGDKVTLKSAIVGRRCKTGAKCRLNNVILMDDVTLGENVILQNTIVGSHCRIGDNCSLTDCQVAPRKEVPSGTKEKGEALFHDMTL